MEQLTSTTNFSSDTHQPDASTFGRLMNLTTFIGRDQETTWIRQRLLEGHRIVTITGPGGVGKTRLAATVASSPELTRAFPDGIFFVSLAPLPEPAMVIPTVARTLGIFADDSESAVQRLAAALDQQRALIIVDNLEHVIGASLDLRRLVDAAPNIKLLVTSRRAMRVSGEQEFSLASLPLPDSGSALMEEMRQSPAVQLFVDRAIAANPGFALTPENAGAVIEICYRLDGLPLAIELAAARTKMLTPQALAARLTGRLQILTAGPRDAPLRQQTLRETVRWSYDLLTPFQKMIFRRMAVFGGGATLEAIGAVAGHGAPIGEFEILDVVATLVDQSMIVQDQLPGREPRFLMLETIREFALAELTAAEDINRIWDAHADYFLKLVEFTAQDEYGPDEPARVLALEPDLGNVRLALGWLLIDREFDSPIVHKGLRMAGAMVRFWDLRGYITEEREWLIHALSVVPEEATSARATALTGLGVNAWFSGRIEEAEEWQQLAIEIWRELDLPVETARSLWFLAIVAAKRGELDRVQEIQREAELLTERIPNALWRIIPTAMDALAALVRGDGETADRYLQACADFHLEHNYPWPRAWTIALMAEAAIIRGDRAAAMKLQQESLALFEQCGDVYAMLDGMLVIARHITALGDAENAARLIGVIQRVHKAVGSRLTWQSATIEDVYPDIVAVLGESKVQEILLQSSSMNLKQGVELALAATGASRRSRPAPPTGGFNLSPRELEILRLLALGKSNQEIGDELFISPRTAGTHVANILGKMGVHSRAAAVSVALNGGLV